MEETTPATEATEKPESFTIQTRDHAEWYLRKVAAIEAEEALVAAQAEALLRRLRSDRESLQGRYQGQFEMFVRGELERTGSKKRSVIFLHGTAQFTSVAPRLVVASEADALTSAAAVLPDAVVEVPASVKLDKKALLDYAKAHFEATGEVLPGLERTEASERFAIKFAAGKGAGEAPAQEGGE